MGFRRPDQRGLVLLVAVSLALLTLLGSVGGPPEVDMSDIQKVEGGEAICVRGIVVDAWKSDAGTLSLIMADLGERSTLKVVCSEGAMTKQMAIHVGDEVRAIGELEVTGGRSVLWSTLDDVELLRPSREALTLEGIADAWELLVGDRFEVVGILVPTPDGTYRLVDPTGSTSIVLLAPEADLLRYEDKKVLADAVLQLREQTMELVLEVHSMSVSA